MTFYATDDRTVIGEYRAALKRWGLPAEAVRRSELNPEGLA
ncbi:hypothetical protein RCO28_10240 [Streptomyces sp. LHD-70]|nr:hypothetical protein [Streptomyces sp. LHD-70]MDQ8702866.1 hypothetical protein [Streptomyces sp. LHD-70]